MHGVDALAVRVLEGDHLQDAHAEGVDVGALVVVLGVHLGRHELRRAYHAARRVTAAAAAGDDGGEAEVADLDLPLAAVNEDVVALEVAVDDAARVEVREALEDLAAPAPDRGGAGPRVSPAVLPQRAGGEELGDEVDGGAAGPGGRGSRGRVGGVGVDPGGVEAHDGAVAERLEQVDLAVETL